jgi:hypothetical protein
MKLVGGLYCQRPKLYFILLHYKLLLVELYRTLSSVVIGICHLAALIQIRKQTPYLIVLF